MDFKEYQKLSRRTALYPQKDESVLYPALGLAGEAGEIVEKIKHIWRDKGMKIEESDKTEISKELGDLLWYLAQVATEFGLDLDDIASLNIEKLASRQKRGKLLGRGDNR